MPELACKIDGCDYEGSPQGLRSHVHGKKGDDDHREAAETRAHHDWYPAAYGLDEEGSDDDGGDAPGATPSDDPPEGGSEGGSEEGSDGEGGDTLETDPSDGGTESPDEADEYGDQWEAVTTPSEGGSEGGSEGASGEGSDDEGGDDPDATPSEGGSKGGSGGLGTALVLGTGALALAVLLRGRGSTPSESPDESGDAIPTEEGADSGSGWSQEGAPTPIEGTSTDEMDFTPTET
jgi:hypothetical protein